MAIQIDDRYVLLRERPTPWLERAYDGWDKVLDIPITSGWFAQSAPLPVLPATIRLRHPAVVGLLDLRVEAESGTWAIWQYFGPQGGAALSELALSRRAACWALHEGTGALAYAREALGRPGGFRIADFQPDMIRLYPDGAVRVAGFGRIHAETGPASEFDRIGEWGGHWLAHSHDVAGDASTEATLPAGVVDALSRYPQADAQPQATVPRILSGLRTLTEGGEGELGRWVTEMTRRDGSAPIDVLYQRFQHSPGDVHQLVTHAHDAEESERADSALPRVRIAPDVREPDPQAEKLHKGLPLQARDRLPWILVGIALLLIFFGRIAFHPWVETLDDPEHHQAWLQTVPEGASVFVDDTLRVGKTPLALDHLRMGWHHVRFEKTEFAPHEDSFLIYKDTPHKPFKFVFSRPFLVLSQPPGAVAYLNGRRTDRPTPTLEPHWPATQPVSVVMHLEQYGSLEDCQLDPLYGTLEVKDPAAWQVSRQGDTLVVTGLFVSTVSFFGSPADSRIVLDDSLDVDPTGAGSYTITMGPHRVRAEALGFDALDTTIVVSARSEKLVPVVLSRPVRIYAYDPDDRDRDLRVLVDRLEGPQRSLAVRRFTPYSVRVPAVAHTVTLSKRNYRDTTVYIPPDVTQIAVAMRLDDGRQATRYAPAEESPQPKQPMQASQPMQRPTPEPVTPSRPGVPWVTVEVTAPGKMRLAGAEIWAREHGESEERRLGLTDEQGELKVQLPEGNYDLLAYLDTYSGIRKRVKVRSDRNRPITIDLQR